MRLKLSDGGAAVTYVEEGETRQAHLELPAAHANAFRQGVAAKNAADAALIVWGEHVSHVRGWPSVYRTFLGD